MFMREPIIKRIGLARRFSFQTSLGFWGIRRPEERKNAAEIRLRPKSAQLSPAERDAGQPVTKSFELCPSAALESKN